MSLTAEQLIPARLFSKVAVAREVKMSIFQKSDMGAQAAWKGFSSQTLYVASRLISDEGGYEYYPEDKSVPHYRLHRQ